MKAANFLIPLSLMLVLVGCASKVSTRPPSGQLEVQVSQAPRIKIDPEIERSSSALHSYLVARLAFQKEQYPLAISQLSRVSELTSKPIPHVHLPLAELLIRSGDLERALGEVQKAIQATPENRQLYLMKAGLFEALGRSGPALDTYQAMIRARSREVEPYYLASIVFASRGELDVALSIISGYRKRYPSDGISTYLNGVLSELKGDLFQARTLYYAYISLSRDLAGAIVDLVRVSLKLDDRGAVRGYLDRQSQTLKDESSKGTLSLLLSLLDSTASNQDLLAQLEAESPSGLRVPDLRLKLAFFQLQQERFSDALRELSMVIAADPKHDVALYYRASLYGGAGRRREAIEDLYRIDSGSSLFSKARSFAAFLLKQEGDRERAKEALFEALASQPDDPTTFAHLISLLREIRDFGQALDLIEARLVKFPDDDRLLFNKGIVLNDLEQTSAAFEVMEQVIQLNPAHADALNYVAYSLAEEGGDFERAEQLINRALQITPNDGFYLDTLGWIYAKTGRLDDALTLLERAKKLSNNDLIVIEHYADVLLALGQIEAAKDAYQDAVESFQDDPSRWSTPEMVRSRDRILKKIAELEQGR